MRAMAGSTLRAFWERYPDAEQSLKAWYEEATIASWSQPAVCVRQTHPRRRDTAATALPAARPLLYYSEAGCQL